MNTIHIISKNEKDRKILSVIFKNLGKKTVFSVDLNDALYVFEKVNPGTVFIVDKEDLLTEIKLREIKRVAPFIPIVVLLKNRDAERALECMKLGAFDCVQFPWTQAEVGNAARKALSLVGTAVELEKPLHERRRNLLLAFAAVLAIISGFILGWRLAQSEMKVPVVEKSYAELPYSHPAGIIFPAGGIMVSDWYTQALYWHDPETFGIVRVKSFADLMPSSLAQSKNYFWLLKTDGEAEKRLHDANLTLLSKAKIPGSRISGMCFDGLYFWSADSRNKTLRKHLNNDNLEIIEKFDYRGKGISAMTCDSRFIWVTDGADKDVKKFPLDLPERMLESRPVKQFALKDLNITGMIKHKNKMYFVGTAGKKGILFAQDGYY